MPNSRQQTCDSAAARLSAAAGSLPSIKALVGFDGFVDEIISVVDKRLDAKRYEPYKTIGQLAKKIAAAAGESSNYELIVRQVKLGGNGPIMANALACAGLGVTYIGNVGFPAIHPAFVELANRAAVISIAEPGYTNALEFDDGKLMLGKYETLHDMNWDNLMARVGHEKFISLTQQARLIGLVNWTMLQAMSHIWEKMMTDVLPKVDRKGKTFFVDLADPEKRTPSDIKDALNLLTRMQDQIDVTLGLNLKEAGEIAEVLHLPAKADENNAIREQTAAIRQKLKLACVVVHPRRGAAAATASETAWFDGPFVQQPKISTGAGDHFNAGFCLGRILGLNLEESLCAGVGTSGYYVRSAKSPSVAELAEFVKALPAPQG